MTANKSPDILLVDDNPDELGPLVGLIKAEGINQCRVLEPGEITTEDLQAADLVLVDFELEVRINSVPLSSIVCKPPNGIAVAAVFRQYSNDKMPPTGYALLTGKGLRFGQMPSERRPHVISRLSNLEWFFEKQSDQKDTARQAVELAKAIHSLPVDVMKGLGNPRAMVQFLGVNDADPLFERYCDAVTRCRPPLHHLSERSHGLIIIRWLLHRILPHTCFLFDCLHLAARLRVIPDSLKTCLSEEVSLVKVLKEFQYNGPLARFDGPRWWRGGIEQWLWNETHGQSADDEVIFQLLQKVGCQKLKKTEEPHPVVTVDKDFNQEQQLSSFSNAVALRLDDWPDYAEPAYATTQTLADHPEMKAFVSD
jgi:hypothetical protein